MEIDQINTELQRRDEVFQQKDVQLQQMDEELQQKDSEYRRIQDSIHQMNVLYIQFACKSRGRMKSW